MKSPLIPTELEEWEFETIDELIKYPDIESETFDFKKEPSDLHEDICAMANTQGGFIVLGISQIDSDDGKKILRFEKTGFELGEEDALKNTVGNYAVKVEPLPIFDLKPVYDKKNNRFFMIIKIEIKITDRPYFIKTTDQCFVRIHNSSRRVGRTAILNLFSSSVEKKNNVEKLRGAANQVIETVIYRSDEISTGGFYEGSIKVPLVDLTFLRDAIISAEWFLREKNLLGGNIGQSQSGVGIHNTILAIERLNVYLESYNNKMARDSNITNYIINWRAGSYGMVQQILSNIVKAADEFLAKYR